MGPPDAPDPLTAGALRQLVDGTAAGIAVLDTELRFVYVNPALARMNGVPAADHTGRTVADLLPDLDTRPEVIRRVLADGVSRETAPSGHTRAAAGRERRYWHSTFHRLEEDGVPVGVVGVVMEVSASRREQQELEQARERLALLDTAVSRIGTTLELDTTCAELAEFLVPGVADLATVEVFPPEQADAARQVRVDRPLRLRRAAMAAVPRLREAARRLGEPGEYVRFQAGSQTPVTLATGRPAIMNLPSDEQLARAAPDSDRVALYRAMGLHSGVVLPLAARGAPLGVLTMARGGRSPAFTREDLTVAQDLAGRAAISLDNARRYTREHSIALELQRALLSSPHRPDPGIEVASRYLPAGSSALVGGDWFDTIHRPLGRSLLVIGDVMGHGVEAAVDMSNYRSMLRVVGAADLPPHHVLRRLDAMIAEAPDSRPASCLLVLADPVRGKLSYARAGHLPPALLHAGGGTQLIQVPAGPPLGTGVGGYEMVTVDWPPGDVLLMYTDGLVEHRNEDIDASLDRLAALRLPVADSLESLLDRLLDHLVRGPAEDDVAVMAARALDPHAA
ncbi:SpoIIE family protein phosphatase [Streptomyces sp. SL13]|uniref:SpoIIE family protein phosphatase n=1 Tax=Streptantibioticus silvisoli TaxID=2705255 RepID=A0AA90H889_9ACTN|nr:SpoIIE family protein phosphatase [Streptantibioticus silvisoli]MDI5962897.1 SpoIIE family protein phosphatase [Streptantibioticus silvisoli]MDI5969727.1 SpoIIE family protein phosphatase [Streptantibioticus silvisoli]